MKPRIALLLLFALLPLGACLTRPSNPGNTGGTAGTGGMTATTSTTGGTSTGGGSSSSSSGGGSDAGPPTTTATLRVHYPLGTHTVTIRGSGAGLSWTQGQPTVAAGNVATYDVTGITSTIEWKPMLDDSTWARGPNYHLSPGQTLDVYPHFTTMKGQVVTLIPTFHSTALANDRAIYAYLPPSYDENTEATFPVVYMQDGQNLWAALPQIAAFGTWNVDLAFDAAAEQGACSSTTATGWAAQPFGGPAATCASDGDCPSKRCDTFPEAIVIGVANTDARIYEYTPSMDTSTPGGGGAVFYVQMLTDELKPQIDSMLRTRPDVASTGLAGSSLGGLVTAWAGVKRPDVFGLLGELSPSTWWDNNIIVDDVNGTKMMNPRPLMVYIDSGSGTADDEADTDQLAQAYTGVGYIEGSNFHHVVQQDGMHNESFWAERFPGAMQFLLGAR